MISVTGGNLQLSLVIYSPNSGKLLSTGIKWITLLGLSDFRGVSESDHLEHIVYIASVSAAPEQLVKIQLAKSIQSCREKTHFTRFTKINIENHEFIWKSSSSEMKANTIPTILRR